MAMNNPNEFDRKICKKSLRHQADWHLLSILESEGLPRSDLARAWLDASAHDITLMDALCGGGYLEETAIIEALANHYNLPIAHPLQRAEGRTPFAQAVLAGALRLADG